jgi:hypothetical protein
MSNAEEKTDVEPSMQRSGPLHPGALGCGLDAGGEMPSLSRHPGCPSDTMKQMMLSTPCSAGELPLERVFVLCEEGAGSSPPPPQPTSSKASAARISVFLDLAVGAEKSLLPRRCFMMLPPVDEFSIRLPDSIL